MERDQVAQTLGRLLRPRDRAEFDAVVYHNPIVRDPGFIALVFFGVEEALREGDESAAQWRWEVATYLTGASDGSAPRDIARLVHARDVLQSEATVEVEYLEACRVLARTVTDSAFVTACHELTAAGTLNCAANVLRACFDRGGSLEDLYMAVSSAGRAATMLDANHPDRPGYLTNLGSQAAMLHRATGRRDVLEQAVAASREAFELTVDGDGEMPSRAHNLSNRLSELAELTTESTLVAEAAALAQLAVERTRLDDPVLASRLVSLSRRRLELFACNGNPEELARAIEDASRAVEVAKAQPSSVAHRSALSALASALHVAAIDAADADLGSRAVALSLAAAEQTPMESREADEALAELAQHQLHLHDSDPDSDPERLAVIRQLLIPKHADGPRHRVRAGRLTARAERLAGDSAAAAAALVSARNAYADEVERLKDDPVGLRDLAGESEGLIGDLVISLVAANRPVAGAQALEHRRVWLSVPEQDLSTSAVGLPVVWLAAGESETVILSNAPQRAVVLELGRATIEGVVREAVRRGGNREHLFALADFLVAHFPNVSDLLVCPLGALSMVPYGAGRLSSGTYLVSNTNVTVAPNVSVARYAHRPRREGSPSVGIFHPGVPHLDLTPDRATFAASFPRAATLERPDSATVLARLGSVSDVAHLSCHGAYNVQSPLDSALLLEDELSLRRLLGGRVASWLVNLSACDTGVPDLGRAEQVLSFPTAFLLAGAAHVLGTLWPIRNDAASAYNRYFYESLAAGLSVAASHRKAVEGLREWGQGAVPGQHRDVEAADSYDDRSLWAGFVHYGSPG